VTLVQKAIARRKLVKIFRLRGEVPKETDAIVIRFAEASMPELQD